MIFHNSIDTGDNMAVISSSPIQIRKEPICSLSPQCFDALFNDNIDFTLLELLGDSAASGELNSIDALLNIALRKDPSGEKAENILYDLFSGKQPTSEKVVNEIQEACKVLSQLPISKEKFSKPSKLLYIIGSIPNEPNLTSQFINKEHLKPDRYPLEETNLFSLERMTTNDEIDPVNKNTEILPDNVTVNCAIGLTQGEANLLGEIIEEKIKSGIPSNQLELFPLNVNNNHWILFALYPATRQQTPSNNVVKCAIFNSYDNLSDDIRKEIAFAAEKAGVDKKDITYIEGNIQQNVPNGCGLFVLEAIKQLTENQQQSPVKTLEEFHEDFAKKTAEEQAQFNIQSRRQLFSAYYDDAYQK